MNNLSQFDKAILSEYSGCLALFFVDSEILVQVTTQDPLLPLKKTIDQLKLHVQSAYYCNPVVIVKCDITFDEKKLLAMQLKKMPIRSFLIHTQPHLQTLTLKAYHWLNWDKQSRYCGQCGALLKNQFTKTEKHCLHCNASFFPRFSPAVMVLISRKNEILLARSKHFTPGVYSAIAGFVDVGETAEMAAHREVKEETGLEINHLRYFSTQTWPFPDSFMISFKANFVSGELTMDPGELEDARWFKVNDLPSLPTKASIARMLIESVVEEINSA